MAIFTVEAIIKLIAQKKLYFKDNWNLFDFVVVVFTAIVVGMQLIPQINIELTLQATLIRVLRILRVLRIIKKLEKLQIIFMTIMTALPSMGSLAALLLMFLFLYSVMGMNIFSFVQLNGSLNEHANFQNFVNAFLLLFRCATGEGWNDIMMDLGRPFSITF
jgi:hypothetical protein